MLYYVTGNLFESPAQALVNTVNTEGVMGKGIALQFRKIYPEMFREYQRYCEEGKLKIGSLHIYRTANKTIINFPTKERWRRPSKPEYIEAGLRRFVSIYEDAGIHSVAFPPLGCGNGELDFDRQVRPLMEAYLRDLPISVMIYPPRAKIEQPEHSEPEKVTAWLRSQPREMPFGEVWHDIRALLTAYSEFHTIAKRTPFVAELTDDDCVWVRYCGKEHEIAREEFQQYWRDLRARGILMSQPANSPTTIFVAAILARLPYVTVVNFAASYDRFSTKPTSALQLIPANRGTAREQLELAT